MICPICQEEHDKKFEEEVSKGNKKAKRGKTKCILVRVSKPGSPRGGRMQWRCPITKKLDPKGPEHYTDPHFRRWKDTK